MPLVRVNWGRYAARLATVLLCLVGVACERDRASVVRVGPTSPDGNWRTYWMFLAGGGATTSRVYGVVVVPAQDTAALAGIKYGAYNVVLAWDKGRADAATVSWRGADTLAVVLDHGRACAYRSEVQVMRSGGIDVDVCVIRLFHR